LWEIDQECFPPGIAYPRQVLAHYLALPGSVTLVGERDGQILGYVLVESKGSGPGHVITIDVVAAARRTGLGSRLMAAAEERLRAAGCTMIFLETAVDNAAALSFYKRHGYAVLKTLPRYYQDSLDGLLLGKRLA
ncbi:MAG: GNAT family N-acetyltransferase, partial [Terriglobales bacterium]